MGRRLTGLLATFGALCGCGSDDQGFAPAAEPAVSPPLEATPGGRLLKLGAEPEGLVVDGRSGLAAAITREPDRLVLVDLEGRRVTARLPLASRGRHLSLARPGGPVLVAAEIADELVSVALPSGRTDSVGVGGFPHGAAAAAGKIFVANEGGDTLSVIEDDELVATLEAPEQPGGIAATAGQVAVVAVAERVLELYDAETLESLGSVPAGVGPTHVVADSGRAYVADTEGDELLVFDLGAEPRLIASAPAPGTPYGIAIDPVRDRLWLTLTATNEAAEYSIAGGEPKLIASHATIRQPNTVAVDPRTGDAIVAGRTAAGPLQRIEPTEAP